MPVPGSDRSFGCCDSGQKWVARSRAEPIQPERERADQITGAPLGTRTSLRVHPNTSDPDNVEWNRLAIDRGSATAV